MMQRVMVSRCLLGEPARYDGSVYFHEHTVLRRWLAEGRVVSVCPEMAGGLPVPRPAAEINSALPPLTLPNGQTSARVVDAAGQDFTQVFVNGAEQMVSLSSGTSPSNTGTVRCAYIPTFYKLSIIPRKV